MVPREKPNKKKEDFFTNQIKKQESSKVTYFLNLFYSVVVGVLLTVVSRGYIKHSKTLGTLLGLLSYLYNHKASRLQ